MPLIRICHPKIPQRQGKPINHFRTKLSHPNLQGIQLIYKGYLTKFLDQIVSNQFDSFCQLTLKRSCGHFTFE
jgi:hypothetical protein